MTFRAISFIVLACLLGLSQAIALAPANAEGMGVVAIVNDVPVTELDITQRINLVKVLGDTPDGGLSRKRALGDIVDQVVKLEEAKRVKMAATDSDISKQIARVSKGMKTTPEGLLKLLAKQGIGEDSFRKYISAQISFNRLISSKYRADIVINPGDIDRKLADIQQKVDSQLKQMKADPRMKGITVYTLMEINLPVEENDAMSAQLLQARAIEATQVAKQFKGCKNAKAAASGVFNVKFAKPVEADAAKLPKPMKSALDKVGPGKTIGPMRSKSGIQLLAFCGSRKISPQVPKFEMPTRQQIENGLINEKYAEFEEAYLKEARQRYYIEYRNPNYTQ